MCCLLNKMLLGAVFKLLPHGGDIAQIGNDLGNDLDDVGLNYLSLNRQSASLSGGESQRIRLATQLR